MRARSTVVTTRTEAVSLTYSKNQTTIQIFAGNRYLSISRITTAHGYEVTCTVD